MADGDPFDVTDEPPPPPKPGEPRKINLPEGFTPFPANPPPEKVGTRPQLGSELHLACFDKDVEGVQAFLAKGTSVGNRYRVNSVDVGTPPLPLACRRPANTAEDAATIGQIVTLLLEAGAGVEGPEGGDSPLILACITGGGSCSKAPAVQALVDAGANLRARCMSLQMTALHWAVTCGFADVVEILLTAGASATTISGKNPRLSVLQMAEKKVAQLKKGEQVARVYRGEDEKVVVEHDATAIKRLVSAAAEQRSEKKAAKAEKKASKAGAAGGASKAA